MKVIAGIFFGIVVLGALYYWMTYNSLVTLNENVDNQWAQVETQYQRRIDLIPSLVKSVQGVMNQEREVFAAIAQARIQYGTAGSINEKAVAAGALEGALGRLLVVMENYPTLKSSESVQTLMVQLEGTENRISVERKRFNDLVRDFNVRIKQVPAVWIAGSLGYSARTYFEAVEGADVVPDVDLVN